MSKRYATINGIKFDKNKLYTAKEMRELSKYASETTEARYKARVDKIANDMLKWIIQGICFETLDRDGDVSAKTFYTRYYIDKVNKEYIPWYNYTDVIKLVRGKLQELGYKVEEEREDPTYKYTTEISVSWGEK